MCAIQTRTKFFAHLGLLGVRNVGPRIGFGGLLGSLVFLAGGGPLQAVGAGESIVQWLRNFDVTRVQQVDRWITNSDDPDALADAARLLYQLGRVNPERLAGVAADSRLQPGQAVQLEGEVTEISAWPVRGELRDVLEMKKIFRVTLQVGQIEWDVITAKVPQIWLRPSASNEKVSSIEEQLFVQGRCKVVGVVVRSDSGNRPPVVAATEVQWFPSKRSPTVSVGHSLLGKYGFNCRLLDDIAEAKRGPFRVRDREPFYQMLRTSQRVANEDLPKPRVVNAFDLLNEADSLTGQWMQIDVELIRVTRVAITDLAMRERMKKEFYWQLDTMGDLGDKPVIIQSEAEGRKQGKSNEMPPVEDSPQFTGRYPVSIAMFELPASLEQRIKQQGGADAIVVMLRVPLTVDGFYYRIWGYQSDFTRTESMKQLFAPLIMGARLTVRAPRQVAAREMVIVGWIVGGGFVAVLVVVSGLLWWIGRRDAAATRLRRERQMADVHLPST